MMSTGAGPKIAILGGGIGGLATAAFLRDKGFDSDVYEQATALTEVGAGLVIAPNAARLLRRLGVLDRFIKRAVRMEIGWEFRRWENGTVLSAENLEKECVRLYGEHTYAAHRADLLNALRSAVPEHSIHLGKRCVSVEFEGDQAVLRFEDGETVRPDILIGADGVHSRVRSAIVGPTHARESGICAFRALVPAEKAPEFAKRRAQTLWIGPDHHLVHYPVSGAEYVNLVAFAPAGANSVESWTATATLGELLDEFAGWDPRLVELIRSADTPGRWALLDREPLDHWNRGNATLLGDAAHPMFPFFAQGAAQAIEDGAVLALCLAETPDNPIAALGRYEELRRRRTARLQEVSHGRSHINHLPDGPEQQARDLAYSQADPLRTNGWIYEYDPEVAVSASV
ncbi:FAD-dependent monooxygenase [Streptomyces sp. DSM 40750]|uniref:FAD-dependent monooxygenase n=1 Tax=Streptomyces sp. DSM 40750 TaxID=2801030 RepID=UPI00214AF21B|nr:FAD-dependent monooxygenase [Streptomyces sp. DSM 40750]UUU26937.1 FAD-dependent monooxygenase [Streptomyces sp. DSM 40750]